MIDLHTHVLAGIDDGPDTIEGSVALARAAATAGIETLVATPHVSSRCPNDAETIGARVRELSRRLAQERVDVQVLPGAEIAISHLPSLAPEELSRLGLGGGPWLLIEPPFAVVALGLENAVLDLLREGRRVVLAHPERCPALHRERGIVRALVEDGVLMSLTAGSLVGRFGGEVRRYALELAREGLVHNVTSDAHDAERRAPVDRRRAAQRRPPGARRVAHERGAAGDPRRRGPATAAAGRAGAAGAPLAPAPLRPRAAAGAPGAPRCSDALLGGVRGPGAGLEDPYAQPARAEH